MVENKIIKGREVHPIPQVHHFSKHRVIILGSLGDWLSDVRVFTILPLASVRLQENIAKQLDLKFRTNFQDISSWYSSPGIRENCLDYKVLIEDTTNRILGADLLGIHAEEVINMFALAIRLSLGVEVLKKGIYTYPTNSSDITYML
ncbi:MAG: hypothetical protein E6L04_04005 [Thaumarchaeota archaeon]|nr:MAG: hypothetical protein E6L04_04005 [Nitrososphaerota archaeon]TLX86756.1 MAG: hypothetical protein E6K97_10480 [Nitrososphaerota archaeon]